LRLIKLILALGLLSAPAWATNYTVKAAGGGNYTTISACASAMSPGDTCTVYVGTYTENPTVSSGTVGNYKTITVNGSDVVNVVGEFTLNSHVKLVGNCGTAPVTFGTCGFSITGVTPTTAPCVLVPDGTTDFYILSNAMTSCGTGGEPGIIWIGGSSTGASYGVVHGNTLSWGCGNSGSPNNCTAIELNGTNHMLVQNNDLSHFGLAIQNFGQYNVIRNNTSHDMNESECGSFSGNCHLDVIYSERSNNSGPLLVQYGLWEGNKFTTCTGVDCKGLWLAADNPGGCTSCFNMIVRYNVLSHFGSATWAQTSGFLNAKHYNNSAIDPNNAASCGGGGASTSTRDDTSSGGAEINELFYYTSEPTAQTCGWYAYNLQASGDNTGFTAGANLAYCQNGTGCGIQTLTQGTSYLFASDPNVFVSNVLASVDPLANYSGGNFNLASGSAAIHAGTYLTKVASGDSGSGTSLVVNDAGFFQDGLGLNAAGVQADCVAVGTVTNVTCITSNPYTGTMTINPAISRSSGQPIWLYSKSDGTQVLTGSAPNIGALGASSTYSITVTSPSNGSVADSQSLISCPSTCSTSSATGTDTLTATPSGGYTYGSWGGGTCAGSDATPCSVSGTATVTATFTAVSGASAAQLAGQSRLAGQAVIK
jgi:hypothetical protein